MAKIKITSDAANKMIRDLSKEYEILLAKERNGATFISTIDEKENDRPKFSLVENRDNMRKVNDKIIALRTAIHQFNVDYILENGISIDVALLNLKSLQELKAQFGAYLEMVDQKRRHNSSTNSKAEYTFLNFDMKYVQKIYDSVCKDIVTLQTLINKANIVAEFEVELPD